MARWEFGEFYVEPVLPDGRPQTHTFTVHGREHLAVQVGDWSRALARHGEHGWELVTVDRIPGEHGDGYRYYLKYKLPA